MLNGHLIDALRYNAMMVVLIPLAVTVILLEALRPRRFERLLSALTSYPFMLGTLIAIILWTILRNLW